jgi:hypothetical protein
MKSDYNIGSFQDTRTLPIQRYWYNFSQYSNYRNIHNLTINTVNNIRNLGNEQNK